MNILNKKIIAFRPMTKEEIKSEGWEDDHRVASVIVLDDGTKLYPSRDEEGNGPGTWFGESSDGTHKFGLVAN
jgi:hypothetical protein